MEHKEKRLVPNREIAVQFDSVFFAYGDVVVLENASFHIHRGDFAALVGPNGSGKTTVLKLILGLEQPASGRITLFDTTANAATITTNAAAEPVVTGTTWRNRLGYVPQNCPADKAFPVSVRDVVRMGLLHPSRGYGAKTRAAVDQAMEQADITNLASRSWRALSGGQQRRTLVARALAAQPELLVLDEPTANMDTESEARLFETLGKLKSSTTILIVTHDTNFVSVLTNRVLCLGDEAHDHHDLKSDGLKSDGLKSHGVNSHGIVQHRTVQEAAAQQARVLHGENIPADDCCEQ
jgi:zinc transport system ATP-binding protein